LGGRTWATTAARAAGRVERATVVRGAAARRERAMVDEELRGEGGGKRRRRQREVVKRGVSGRPRTHTLDE